MLPRSSFSRRLLSTGTEGASAVCCWPRPRRLHISHIRALEKPPPPPPPRASLWKRFLQVTGSITLVTIATGTAFYYVAQKDRTPGVQLPHDPTKKTLVILGSGWGATSLLNSLETADYNVVSNTFSPLCDVPAVTVRVDCH